MLQKTAVSGGRAGGCGRAGGAVAVAVAIVPTQDGLAYNGES